MEALQKEKRYTYADYCTWDDGERWELIDGIPYAMSPAPLVAHQAVVGNLHYQLFNFLKGHLCRVYLSPFDVRLNPDTDDDTVVQPDLLVVCDKSKLDKRGCNGAPDMIIEVLSPSNTRRDTVLKLNTYKRAGVREYWIVDPDTKAVSAYLLKDGEYIIRAYADADTAPVHILEGCTISLQDVFAE